jgi:serine protease inhibitor
LKNHQISTLLINIIVIIFFSSTICLADELSNSFETLSSSDSLLVEAINNFSFNIFEKILEENPDTNIVLSPFSISYALAMAYNGAGGDTREAMKNVMELGELTDQQINDSYKKLMYVLTGQDSLATFEIANSMWLRSEFTAKESYKELCRNYYNSEVTALDFNDPKTREIINKWVFDHTHGRIQNALDRPIPLQALMYLINTIYLKAYWTSQFDKHETGPWLFWISDSSSTYCDMMKQKNEYSYLLNKNLAGISLPYGNNSYNMVILLPRKINEIDNMLSWLSEDTLSSIMSEFKRDTVTLHIPKFKTRCSFELDSALMKMGLDNAFKPGIANFTGIAGGIYFGRAWHKTFIQVDEEGTEAAAFTAIRFDSIEPPPVGLHIHIDRPYFFMIHDINTGVILFMGKILNPVWEE